MTNTEKKTHDLEERTLRFAKEVIDFTTTLPKTIFNMEIIKQVVRSAGSIDANYIEADEALSRKNFAIRIKISRKEAKETVYRLKLIQIESEASKKIRGLLIGEASELTKIFGAIVTKIEV